MSARSLSVPLLYGRGSRRADDYRAFLLCLCWLDNYLSPSYSPDFSSDSLFWVPNEPFQLVTPFIIHGDSRRVTFSCHGNGCGHILALSTGRICAYTPDVCICCCSCHIVLAAFMHLPLVTSSALI